VIVYDFDIMRRAVFPAKAHPPLLIDTNAMVPSPIALELLEAIPKRHPKFIQRDCGIEQQQLAEHDAPQCGWKSPHRLSIKQSFSIAVGETGDHDK